MINISTKCSIKWSDKKGYHLYADGFDMMNVYLRLKCKFTANNDGVTITIPREIWNELITTGELEILSDEEVAKRVKKNLEEFAKKHEKNKND